LRVRVLQDLSAQGLREAALNFDSQLQQKSRAQTVAAKYGLAYIAFRQGTYDKALALVQEARSFMAPGKSMPLASLAIDIRLTANQPSEALKEAELARSQFPVSRGIAHQYADALVAAGRYADAERYLRDQAQLYRQEPQLQDRLAKVYAAQGKQSLQHLALAESYALQGSLSAALDQLSIARRASDATFFDQSVIESREKELQARMREELRERQEWR
jgi:beta-barrel assembly-enhancing protease